MADPLAPHCLVRRMPDLPTPPPNESPMAGAAPPLLTAFIYYMTRDLIPVRYIEATIAHIRAHPKASGDPDLMAYAERKARELCYEPTKVAP